MLQVYGNFDILNKFINWNKSKTNKCHSPKRFLKREQEHVFKIYNILKLLIITRANGQNLIFADTFCHICSFYHSLEQSTCRCLSLFSKFLINTSGNGHDAEAKFFIDKLYPANITSRCFVGIAVTVVR